MKVRFENIDRQTPANLAIQVRTLPHEFDGLYLQNAHPDLHPVAGKTRLSIHMYTRFSPWCIHIHTATLNLVRYNKEMEVKGKIIRS